MEENAFMSLVEEILEVGAGTLSMSDLLDDIGWDSLSNISFIAEVDARLGVSVNADQLSKANTVSEIHALTVSSES